MLNQFIKSLALYSRNFNLVWYMPHENVLWLTYPDDSICLRVTEYKRHFKIQYSFYDWQFPKETKDKNIDLAIQLAEMIYVILKGGYNDS